MHGLCDAEFTGSHMSHAAEYSRPNPMEPIPGPGPWIEPSIDYQGSETYNASPTFGRTIYASCGSWSRSDINSRGRYLLTSGRIDYTGCNTVRPVACCF